MLLGKDGRPEGGSPYDALAPDLRDTLARSLHDRHARSPGSEHNLMFAFPPSPRPAPRTIEEALDNLSPMAVNLLVRLFDRMARIDRGLWKQIRWIRNQWWGGSAGIKVVYDDPAKMRASLDALRASTNGHPVGRDTYLGAIEHQRGSLTAQLVGLALRPSKLEGPPPDCDTWREVHVLAGEGVHFCVGRADLKGRREHRMAAFDDIHIDWMSPAAGIHPTTGRCRYRFGQGLRHWRQAISGQGAPAFTFLVIDRILEEATALAARVGRRDLEERLLDFAVRWHTVEKRLAVDGKRGYEASLRYHDEVICLARPLRAALDLEREREKEPST